jgi:accessory colonization factor AcfC
MKKITGVSARKCRLIGQALAFVCLIVVWAGTVWAEGIRVYIPGGLKHPMEQCAEAFGREQGISVTVFSGEGPRWMDEAAKNADLISLGAAHLYSQFATKYRGVIENSAWEGLYTRPAGILVRKGNPRGIKGLEDLAEPGRRLLNVACMGQAAAWEDIAGRKGLTEALLRNFAVTVPTGLKGAEVWRKDATLEAWLTFASWHYMQKNETDLVEIPDQDNVFRETVVAMTNKCKDRDAAAKFIAFLKSEKAHAIFQEWGWR